LRFEVVAQIAHSGSPSHEEQIIMRAFLWRMGVDYLLDQIRDGIAVEQVDAGCAGQAAA
jgi:hypothetical protein